MDNGGPGLLLGRRPGGVRGRLLLETRAGEEFLFLPSLATGIGDVDLGLDRGTIGDAQLARFERTGPHRARLAGAATGDPDAQAHRQLVTADIERFMSRRDGATSHRPGPGLPPGAPIGATERP